MIDYNFNLIFRYWSWLATNSNRYADPVYYSVLVNISTFFKWLWRYVSCVVFLNVLFFIDNIFIHDHCDLRRSYICMMDLYRKPSKTPILWLWKCWHRQFVKWNIDTKIKKNHFISKCTYRFFRHLSHEYQIDQSLKYWKEQTISCSELAVISISYKPMTL